MTDLPWQRQEWPDAAISERFARIDDDLKALDGVVAEQARLGSDVSNAREALSLLRTDVAAMALAIKARDTAIMEENRERRRSLYLLAGTLGAALIAAIATVLAAGLAG